MDAGQNRVGLFSNTGGTARNSTLCGIVMLAGWVFPLLAIPLGIGGFVMGLISLTSQRRDLARTGIFLNGLGLGLTALNVFLAAYLLLSGKLDQLLMFQ